MGSLNKKKTFPVFLFTCIFVFISDLPLSSHDTQWWPFRADPSSGNLCIQRVLHDNTVTLQGLVCSIIYRRLLCVGTNSYTHTIGDTTLKTGNGRPICIYTACCIYWCFLCFIWFPMSEPQGKNIDLSMYVCMYICLHVWMHLSIFWLYISLTKHATWPVTISLCHLVQTPSLHNPNPA